MNKEILNCLESMRASSPLVHCITNYVVMGVSANALLAAGASPLMAHAQEEMDDLLKIVSALVLNIGTLDKYWVESMHVAAEFARKYNKPVVLDPVGAGASKFRTSTSLDILKKHDIAVVRGNASEIMALGGDAGLTKGVDSIYGSTEALDYAKNLAKQFNTTVSVSGEVDIITDGETVFNVFGGNPIMTKVTGMGCSATAITAACVVTASSPLIGASAGMALMAEAGENAAKQSSGPGSFLPLFLDNLYTMDMEKAAARVRKV